MQAIIQYCHWNLCALVTTVDALLMPTAGLWLHWWPQHHWADPFMSAPCRDKDRNNLKTALSFTISFTICGICDVFAVTLIWIVQNYLQLVLRPVILIIAIHFCMVSQTLSSPNFNVFRIDWCAWWQSLHLLAVFHCFVLFVGCQEGLEYCSRSVCWPTKSCMKNNLFIFTPCLLHHSHPVHRDQTKILVCQSLGLRPTQARAFHSCAPPLWNNLPLSVHSAISVATFKKDLKTHFFDLAFPA